MSFIRGPKLCNKPSPHTSCIGLTAIQQAGPGICELQQSVQELVPIKYKKSLKQRLQWEYVLVTRHYLIVIVHSNFQEVFCLLKTRYNHCLSKLLSTFDMIPHYCKIHHHQIRTEIRSKDIFRQRVHLYDHMVLHTALDNCKRNKSFSLRTSLLMDESADIGSLTHPVICNNKLVRNNTVLFNSLRIFISVLIIKNDSFVSYYSTSPSLDKQIRF